MHPGIPLAYAARHMYAPNEDPYRASPGRQTAKQRRRRRRSTAFLRPGRARLAFFHRRTAPGR
jgi:hypothetical protein